MKWLVFVSGLFACIQANAGIYSGGGMAEALYSQWDPRGSLMLNGGYEFKQHVGVEVEFFALKGTDAWSSRRADSVTAELLYAKRWPEFVFQSVPASTCIALISGSSTPHRLVHSLARWCLPHAGTMYLMRLKRVLSGAT